jgi:hypothetical protein
MNNDLNLKASSAWTLFTYVSFGIAAVMMAGGIYFLEASFAAKGFYAMSALMLVHTTVALSKSLRDDQESSKMINKIEDARTEKLIMEMNRANA